MTQFGDDIRQWGDRAIKNIPNVFKGALQELMETAQKVKDYDDIGGEKRVRPAGSLSGGDQPYLTSALHNSAFVQSASGGLVANAGGEAFVLGIAAAGRSDRVIAGWTAEHAATQNFGDPERNIPATLFATNAAALWVPLVEKYARLIGDG